MMPYIHFTEEQKLRAGSVDLPEFFRRRGEKLLRSGREYRMASDRSVTVRGNEWYDHETGQGGGPISFLQTRCGLSYPEAVSRLLEERRKKFAPPPGNREMRRVYAYLLQKRRISREVLTAFVRAGLVYEDAEYHNAVFVLSDEHGVVVFGVLIDEPHPDKGGEYLPADAPLPEQVGVDPAHLPVPGRKSALLSPLLWFLVSLDCR